MRECYMVSDRVGEAIANSAMQDAGVLDKTETSMIVDRSKLGRECSMHQLTAASMWLCGPRPRLGWAKMVVCLAEASCPEHSSYTNHFFAVLPPEQPQKGSMLLL